MPFQLILSLDYQNDTRWRWILSDAAGRFLADQDVALDPADPMYRGFVDLPGQLRFYDNVRPAEDVLLEAPGWDVARFSGQAS